MVVSSIIYIEYDDVNVRGENRKNWEGQLKRRMLEFFTFKYIIFSVCVYKKVHNYKNKKKKERNIEKHVESKLCTFFDILYNIFCEILQKCHNVIFI